MTRINDLIDRLTELRDGEENITSVHLLNPDPADRTGCPFVKGLVLLNTGAVYLTDLNEQQVNDAGYKSLLQEYIPVSGKSKYEVEVYVGYRTGTKHTWVSIFTTTSEAEATDFFNKLNASVHPRIRVGNRTINSK